MIKVICKAVKTFYMMCNLSNNKDILYMCFSLRIWWALRLHFSCIVISEVFDNQLSHRSTCNISYMCVPDMLDRFKWREITSYTIYSVVFWNTGSNIRMLTCPKYSAERQIKAGLLREQNFTHHIILTNFDDQLPTFKQQSSIEVIWSNL